MKIFLQNGHGLYQDWADRGPHVTCHSVVNDRRKHSGTIFKSEICWKLCEVPSVTLNCLHWINCICTRTSLITRFLCAITVFVIGLFIYFAIKFESIRPSANRPSQHGPRAILIAHTWPVLITKKWQIIGIDLYV